jgi:hypothetical protein
MIPQPPEAAKSRAQRALDRFAPEAGGRRAAQASPGTWE